MTAPPFQDEYEALREEFVQQRRQELLQAARNIRKRVRRHNFKVGWKPNAKEAPEDSKCRFYPDYTPPRSV